MLLIVISHGYRNVAANTRTFYLPPTAITIITLRNVLQFIEECHSTDTFDVDEVMIVDNDELLYHYTEQDLDEEYETLDVSEVEIVEKVA